MLTPRDPFADRRPIREGALNVLASRSPILVVPMVLVSSERCLYDEGRRSWWPWRH